MHYDSEAGRRPLLHELVKAKTLPTSYATDDGIAILYEGTEPVAVIADTPGAAGTGAAGTGPAAYRVELVDGKVIETRLEVGPITLS